jgi:hypothetical protein
MRKRYVGIQIRRSLSQCQFDARFGRFLDGGGADEYVAELMGHLPTTQDLHYIYNLSLKLVAAVELIRQMAGEQLQEEVVANRLEAIRELVTARKAQPRLAF